jgi:hypothetical protein
MALPGDLATCVCTGTFVDPAGQTLKGSVSFTPNVPLADPGDSVTIWPITRTYDLSGGSFTATLLGTDASQIVRQGWAYVITVSLQNAQPYTFTAYLPSADSPLDISELTPLQPIPQMGAYLPVTGGTMLGPLYAAGNPTSALQVATMGYVESLTSGLAAKNPCQEATAAALIYGPATYSDGVLSPLTVGALVADGVSVAPNDRVLVKNEASPANNGIYVCTAQGSVSTPWQLTRSSDMDTDAQVPGAYAFVEHGTDNEGFGFIVAGVGPYVLGTTAIVWTQFTSTGDLTAGPGLTLSGSTMSLDVPVALALGGTGVNAASNSALLADLGAAPLASPALTGIPVAPTASALTGSTQLATTAYADSATGVEKTRAEAAEALLAPLASPALTGSPTAPTKSPLTDNTDIATTAYADSAVGVETSRAEAAEAAKAGLLTPVSVTQSSGTYSAAAGALVKANISGGSWTMELPAAPASNTIAGAKIIAQATGTQNTLTVACGGSDRFEQSGGATSVTMSMPLQAAAWQYNGGYWTRLSDDLPLGQMDGRYTRVYSPVAFGAVGDGSHDDTAAVQAAFAAASPGGTVGLGSYNFLTSSPVDLASNVMVRGSVPVAAPGYLGAGAGQLGSIVNNTGDIFQMPSGNVAHVVFENCGLVASAGHVWNAQGVSCSSWNILNVFVSQTSNSHAIWYQPNVSSSADSQAYSNMLVGDGCYFLASTGSATMPAWYVMAQANINSNTWRRMTVGMNNSESYPFFYLENIGTNGSQLASDDVFEDITAEECQGGILKALSVDAMTLRNVQGWDASYYQPVFTIGTSTTGLQPSNGIVAISSGRRGGTLQSGAYDFQASSDTLNLVLINTFAQLGQDETTSLSVPQSTTIIPAQTYTPAAYGNSAAGGTATDAVTTGNSGGASGTAWSGVDGTVTFDSTEILAAGSSTLAYKLAGSASTAYLEWSVPNSVFPRPVQYLRVYFYLSATSFNCDILSGPGLNWRVTYNSGGALYADGYPGAAANGITTIAAATWYRLEAAISQAAGTITAKLYNVNGVLLETMTGTGGTYTSNGTAYYGSQDAFTGSVWLAYPAWSNQGWIGP